MIEIEAARTRKEYQWISISSSFSSSDVDTLQFQLTLEIPKIKVRAQYRSSGVLILVQASGAGDYWGQYGEITRSKAQFFS